MKTYRFTAAKQGGFSMIEMVIVVAAMLVLLGIAMNWVMGLSKDARNAQESDMLAKELNLIGKATKQYLVAAPATTYPLNTSVDLPVSTLVTAGFLPTDFAARQGPATAAISPFGQPYMVVVRRIVAGEPPTAVVSESSIPLPVKLAKVGVEDNDAAILALKKKVAAQSGRDYKTIAATVDKSSRSAIGVGSSFTKDLTDYFAAGFVQSSALALVNFKDLEPGGNDGSGGNPVADAPKYSNCKVIQGQLSNGITNFVNVCSSTSGPGHTESGKRTVGDSNMDVCGGNGNIVVLPFGGTLTSGLDTSALTWSTNNLACPGDWDSTALHCANKIGRTYGVITMNSVAVDSKSCSFDYYGQNTFHHQVTQQAEYNVCCTVVPLP